ncbi:MAG: hypothetical protein AUK44_01020 [Porphyromonadaceae bacterium CG2_30_38_12]|nr:MAG: hypothetical protein AUK44_01020 [Porphyromonadaceae bacterium CG2_30_38_12]
MRNFIEIAFRKKIAYTAIKVAVVVGTLLNLINQWTAISTLDFENISISRLLLTYCVPYLVSTFSAVQAKNNFTK